MRLYLHWLRGDAFLSVLTEAVAEQDLLVWLLNTICSFFADALLWGLLFGLVAAFLIQFFLEQLFNLVKLRFNRDPWRLICLL